MTGAVRLLVVVALGGGAVVAARLAPTPRRVVVRPRAPGDRPGFAAVVGALVRRRAGRPVDAGADRRLGRALVVGALLMVIDPVVAIGAASAAWVLPWWRGRRQVARCERKAEASVPDLVDLVRLGVTAGLPVRGALAAAAAHLDGPLADRVGTVLADAGRGRPLADALAGADLGAAARPLVDALVAGERYGAPLSSVLERVADEARRSERLRAERAARRLPVALLFPLVMCTLPAFALVTVVPVLVTTLSALDG